MAIEIKLPELGENIESADVVAVLVKEGDKVQKDQGLLEIETDKATIEVPSTQDGIVQKVLIKAGEKIKVGQTVMILEESSSLTQKPLAPIENTEQLSTKETNQKETLIPESEIVTTAQIIDVVLPDLGENIESADVVSVLVKVGDKIEKDRSIIEIETDKATVEVPSPSSGEVVEVMIKSGTKAKVGAALIRLRTSGESKVKLEKEEVKIEKVKTESEAESIVKTELTQKPEQPGQIIDRSFQQPPITKGSAPAAPSVRRIAREIGIDINEVPGTGTGGRISMYDVKAYATKLNDQRGKGV